MKHFNVPSEKNPNKKYLVSVGGDVRTCTCPSYQYNPDKDCKHITAVLQSTNPPGVERKASTRGHTFDLGYHPEDIGELLHIIADAVSERRVVEVSVR